MAFDPDAYLKETAPAGKPAAGGFDPDAYLAQTAAPDAAPPTPAAQPDSLWEKVKDVGSAGRHMFGSMLVGAPAAILGSWGGVASKLTGNPASLGDAIAAGAQNLSSRAVKQMVDPPRSERAAEYVNKAGDALGALGPLMGHAGEVAHMAGMAGPVAAQAGQAARTGAGAVARAMPSNPIPAITGSRLEQALSGMRGKFGGAQEELGMRAQTQSLASVDQVREQANKARSQGLDALRVIRGQEISNAQSVEQAGKAAENAGAASLRGRLAEPLSTEQTFAKVKQATEKALSDAFEHRKQMDTAAYKKSDDIALAAERSGNGFAQHPEGQALLQELRAMKEPGPGGYGNLTTEQTAAVDKLIDAIAGKQATTTAPVGSGKVTSGMTRTETTQKTPPASMKVLTNELRELRKVNERSSPVEGYGALGVEFSRDLAGMMSRHMYEWNPAYAAADAEYTALSQGMNRFKTERMQSATRGEKFDFKEFAASPDEFARFFKTGEGVRDLKAALGDDALVKQVGKEWAAHELRAAKGAGKVEEWMAKNQDWLRESGALPDVQAYAQDLAGHEAGLSKARAAGEARAGTLKQAAGMQQQNVASIGKTAEAEMAGIAKNLEGHQAAAKAVSDLINFENPRNIASKFDKNVLPELRRTGLMSEEELSSLQAEVRKVNQMADDQRKARWVAAKIAAALGVAGYVSTSTSGPR
jgi:hypothetical protein